MHYDALIVGGSFAGLSAAAVHDCPGTGTPARVPERDFCRGHGQFKRIPGDAGQRRAAIGGKTGAGVWRPRRAAGHPWLACPMGRQRAALSVLPWLRIRWAALGVLYRMPLSAHQAQLIADWGATTLFMNGDETLEMSERARLQARGIAIESGRVIALEGAALQLEGIRLEGGRLVPIDALYLAPRTQMRSPIAGELGCAYDDGPIGPVIRTDATKMTTVPGVYAAGDAAQLLQNATLASADGVLAGVSLHQALVFGN